MSSNETPANRISELLELKGWHRSKVAAACNVSETIVYRWETGKTPIPSDQLPTLAELFEASIEHLMGWDREPVTGKAA